MNVSSCFFHFVIARGEVGLNRDEGGHKDPIMAGIPLRWSSEKRSTRKYWRQYSGVFHLAKGDVSHHMLIISCSIISSFRALLIFQRDQYLFLVIIASD